MAYKIPHLEPATKLKNSPYIHFYSESVLWWHLGSIALIRYNFSQMNHIILVWLVVLGDNRLDLFSQFKQNYSQL